MEKKPFVVAVGKEILDDLRERLARTRWPNEAANADWQYGTQLAYLKELVAYWLDGYDWRRHELAINAFPHYRTTIDRVHVHFIHQPGIGPNPLPLILTHGWPWTFWDFHKVIRPLSDPKTFGGDPQDAFDVIVPSLPGYGFSTPLSAGGLNYWRTADLWVKLMEGLGYDKFGAQGGDWGAMVSAQLGHAHAERIIGAHINLAIPLSLQMPDASEYSAEEEGWNERAQNFWNAESGYFALQSTKPQTLAYGLNDSPVGLCAWIVEKRRTWSDCEGDVERRFTKDDLLNTIMLYWITESFGSSVRYYYEATHHPWQPSHNRVPVIEAPTGVAVFPREIILMPRHWAERYYNLKRWTVMPSGGHFAPMEEPESLVEDIRAFFRSLR
ncbi:MAG: epoxide hydrolase [Candidatus Binatia bacterium]|nr:epoxide hydrolase [Candidatus Binatia bacterium]